MINLIGTIVFIMIMLFTHLIVLSIQSISSKDYFYGVYIKSIYLENEFKDKIDKEFKSSMNKVLIIVIAIHIISEFIFKLNLGINLFFIIILYCYFAYFYLKNAYIKVKEYKIKYIKANDINISKIENKIGYKYEYKELILVQNQVVKKFKILFSICIGISILSALYVVINYKSMPDTIITHWGISGNADGFSKKTIKSVFLVNFIDLSMVIFLTYLSIESLKAKVYIEKGKEKIKKFKKYLNGIGYSFLFLTLSIQLMTTTMPIFMVKQENIPISIIIIGCIIPIFISVSLIYFYIMLSSLKSKDKNLYQMENDDEKWIYGFIYYNKEDPQFLVEKRLGIGWNINMATTKGKVFTILILVMTVGSLILPFI